MFEVFAPPTMIPFADVIVQLGNRDTQNFAPHSRNAPATAPSLETVVRRHD